IRLFLNDRELIEDGVAGDIFSNCGESKILNFRFCTIDKISQYSSKDQEIYQNFLSICGNVGLSQDSPAYPYLRFIKFLYTSSYHSPFTTHSIQETILRQPLSFYVIPKINSV